MNTSEEVRVQGQAFRMACRDVNFIGSMKGNIICN